MKWFVLSCLLVVGSSVSAQIVNLQGSPTTIIRENTNSDITGSKYLFPTYQNAVILEADGTKFNALVMLDTHENELQIYNDGSPIILFKASYPKFQFNFFDEISNERIDYIFQNGFNVAGYKAGHYFQVIYQDDRINVLKAHVTKLVDIKDESGGSYGTSGGPKSQFKNIIKYYLVEGNAQGIEIKASKAGVITASGDFAEEMKQFIKSNKLRFKSDSDLGKAFKYYSELLSTN